MTSAEFAAKYRVLKTLIEYGARTQIAQEFALGRMVMVHHLDLDTPSEGQRLVARLGSLTPDAASISTRVPEPAVKTNCPGCSAAAMPQPSRNSTPPR